jgi:hypothetical protein
MMATDDAMEEFPFAALFDEAGRWQVFASGQAEGSLTEIPGGAGLRFAYDFHGGGGFVVMRRVIGLRLPDTFEIRFRHRGEGLANHFEFKVASTGGANVWRHLRQDYPVPREWTEFRFHEREFPFAWGPAGGGGPCGVEAIEIVVAAGPGGKGHIDFAGAALEDQTLREPLAITASSHLGKHEPQRAFKPDPADWRAAPDDPSPWWGVDFGRRLRFGGLVIDWPEDIPPRAYRIEVSDDGESWASIHRAERALGARSHIPAQGAEARHLRLAFDNSGCAALRCVSLRPDAFASTPNEFIHAVAADYPRGWHPRYWHREQSYWTPVGSPDGRRRALINEEGMVEVDEGGFSLEPFVLTSRGPLTWADVRTSVASEKHGTPLPRVTWKSRGMKLDILPWVDGGGDHLALHVTYRLKVSKSAGATRFAVAVRPFQVNPPWQAFRNLGGRSPIRVIACEDRGLEVDGRMVIAAPAPSASGAAMFEEGRIAGFLTKGETPDQSRVEDASLLASGLMLWDIPPGACQVEITVSTPYFGNAVALRPAARATAVRAWKRALGKVKWQVPACALPAFDCLRNAAGHILINRDGAAIQPGPRRYTRSWVRDCVIMGAALARTGIPHALREFLDWYAPFQREDGFVPCVVDRDGIDWLVEHDSHGQFLWGLREVMRQSADADFLVEMLPRAKKAADFLIALRMLRKEEPYRGGAFHGLLPESASHEGYLAHPVHSYWDDFWGIRGLEAAADLAQAAGLHDEAARWRREAAAFQEDVLASISKVISGKKLNYIPGSVEWADFDPTATSNAIAMLDFAAALPAAPLHAMLETYLDGHRRKHSGAMPWNNYTAYEIRIIGAFVRLGKRDIANELLDFFLSDRRPAEWNQWPEITWRDPRSPGHLGDVPHTWIAAEFILALASMVAAEREAGESLVLAAGLRREWIAENPGFSVGNLPTRFGPLHFSILAPDESTIRVRIADSIRMPGDGLFAAPPLPAGKRIISAGGHGAVIGEDGMSIRITALPFSAELRLDHVRESGQAL